MKSKPPKVPPTWLLWLAEAFISFLILLACLVAVAGAVFVCIFLGWLAYYALH